VRFALSYRDVEGLLAERVNPTPDKIRASLGCFEQHCAPERLTAAQAIDTLLNADQLPAVVNMSLGTHVGPHNGQSPLEHYISRTLTEPRETTTRRLRSASILQEALRPRPDINRSMVPAVDIGA
jgi:hypothetical protein